jgi:Dolichyl-phosphate-mannose-protein mannosyltransferase
MYALQVLLIALSYLFLLMALKQNRTGVWSLYVLVTGLSLYAQYTSFLSVAAQNIYIILVRRRHRDSLKAWGMAQAAIALLFLPWVPQLLSHLQEKARGYWIRPLTWDMPVKFFSLLSGSYLTNERGRWMVVAITLAVLAMTLVVVWREQEARDRALLLTLWLFVPVMLLVLVSLRQNLFLPRVILYVAPAFALLMGLGVDRLLRLSQRTFALAVLGVLFILNLHALYGYYTHSNEWVKSPLRTISALIAREFRPGDIVVHSSQFSYRPLQFYLNQNVRQGLLVATEKRPGLLGIIGTGQMPHDSAQYRRIWLVVFTDFLQPGASWRVVDWMNAHHRLQRMVLSSETLYVGLYERGDAPLGPP